MLSHTMPDLRKAVLAELERREWSRYRLTKELEGKVPPATIYQFLEGRSPINSDYLGKIMDALNLDVKPRRTRT